MVCLYPMARPGGEAGSSRPCDSSWAVSSIRPDRSMATHLHIHHNHQPPASCASSQPAVKESDDLPLVDDPVERLSGGHEEEAPQVVGARGLPLAREGGGALASQQAHLQSTPKPQPDRPPTTTRTKACHTPTCSEGLSLAAYPVL